MSVLGLSTSALSTVHFPFPIILRNLLVQTYLIKVSFKVCFLCFLAVDTPIETVAKNSYYQQ